MAGTKKRDRGRILTEAGYKKIWAAIYEVFPDRQTHAAIARWTDPLGDNPNAVTYTTAETISKILNQRQGVELKTLDALFRAFGLTLQDSDHILFNEKSQPKSDPTFVGREKAFADLDALIKQGAKVIVIKAAGGVGKTTLAQRYLQQKFGSFIEFRIAKETKDIASVETWVEQKLRELGEEPGRELMVSLDRLKRKLQSEEFGILIDNLEPALNARGEFIDEHRSYVELLRILTDPLVQSVTLITSRETLRESSISLEHYPLECLELTAWEQFFQNLILDANTKFLPKLHHAYAGNAKAMELLRSSIFKEYSGDIDTYWLENQDDLLIESDLESLVIKQFDRLRTLDMNAYKLLIRMGCYRYQDVPSLPVDGLICLLWDVPKGQHKRAIKSLQDRSLVDCLNNHYWLHPIIREVSIQRLRGSGEWEDSNQKAAEYFKMDAENINSSSEAIRALEEFYHHFVIGAYDDAIEILPQRTSIGYASPSRESLIGRLRGFGLYQKCLNVLEMLAEKKEYLSYSNRAFVFGYLGDILSLLGFADKSILHYQESKKYFKKSSFIDLCDNIAALAIVYINIGEYELALKELESVVAFKDKLESDDRNMFILVDSWMAGRILASSYASLALINLQMNKQVESLLNLESAIDLSRLNQRFLGSWWENYGNYNLARALICASRIEESRKVCVYLHKHSKLKSDPMSKGLALSAAAEAYLSQSQFSKATKNFERAVKTFRHIGAKQQLAEALARLALLYKRYDLPESRKVLEESITLFEAMGAPKKMREVQEAYDSLVI